MFSDGDPIHFDHQLSHADGTAIAENVRVKPHPEKQLFTYHHVYAHDPGLQRIIEVTATGGAQESWEEVDRTGKLFYKNARGETFAQFEHRAEENGISLLVGMPQENDIDTSEALVQVVYRPDRPTQILLQANAPDFSTIEGYPNWEQYVPYLRYYLQDETFLKKAQGITDQPYREEYNRFVENADLSASRFLDKLLLTDIHRYADELLARVVVEIFPGNMIQQQQGWDILKRFGMHADFSLDIADEVLQVYRNAQSLISIEQILSHVVASEITQNVIDKTTKRILQFQKSQTIDTVACVLLDGIFHAKLQRRKFGRNTVETLARSSAIYGETIPMPDGHTFSLYKNKGLLYVVCDATRYKDAQDNSRMFRHWEIAVPYMLPHTEMQEMLLSRSQPFQQVRNVAPVVFLKPHEA